MSYRQDHTSFTRHNRTCTVEDVLRRFHRRALVAKFDQYVERLEQPVNN
ncbi:hypothetical protein SAMN02787118_12028 [Streptomyces mirabilis]|uniref:Uncharacterized protein n=1 Tax=Streptomyces mirabilis TaxID=68239 RepID=A0A1I2RIS2_9ACTN|nr:hypothetical protein SAMN02787118_12028 [Streptomyces mirabilis]